MGEFSYKAFILDCQPTFLIVLAGKKKEWLYQILCALLFLWAALLFLWEMRMKRKIPPSAVAERSPARCSGWLRNAMLDGFSGYNHILVAPEDRYRTAIDLVCKNPFEQQSIRAGKQGPGSSRRTIINYSRARQAS